MPIETEVKYLMQPSTTADWLASKNVLQRGQSYVIHQIYIGTARMRAIYHVSEDSDPEVNTFTFTWKHPVEEGRLEIEKEISEADFMIGAKAADRYLWKRREEFWLWIGAQGIRLELDSFFDLDSGKVYLTLIEVEYRPDQEHLLPQVEKVIGSRLRERVAMTDTRFDNYRLADPTYLSILLSELGGTLNSISLVG